MHIWSNSGRIQLRELLWQVTFPRKKFILDFFSYAFVQVAMEKKSARISPKSDDTYCGSWTLSEPPG